MERTTIAQALTTLEHTLQTLDNAYWEVNKIGHKDTLYDLISLVHIEMNEMAKLSVEDHYLAYEPITILFRNSHHKFKRLQSNLHRWVNRSATARHLEVELQKAINLLSDKS